MARRSILNICYLEEICLSHARKKELTTYLPMFLVKTPPPRVRMGHYLLTVLTGLHPDSFPLKGRDKCSLTTRASISPLSQTTQIRGRSIIYSLGNALL